MTNLYSPDPGWAKLPRGWSFVEVAGVATDSNNLVYVFNRGEHPLIIFAQDGRFIYSWGEGQFVRAHGIHIGPDDTIYLTDDLDYTVRKFDKSGELLMTLGVRGRPSDTGVQNGDYRTIQRSAGPFNEPTNVALSAAGEIFVTDGYGNARVHKFSPDGELMTSWAEPGTGRGQFQIPHGIAIDSRGIVFVADRESDRIQLFDQQGRYLDEWTDVQRPTEIAIDSDGRVWVSELGWRTKTLPGVPPRANPVGSRISIFSMDGALEHRWGGGDDPNAPGDFYALHDIWLDSHGDVYASEVTVSAGGNPNWHVLQKLTHRTTESRGSAA
jgi:DNA-binding beta-propeller fold protein YncE